MKEGLKTFCGSLVIIFSISFWAANHSNTMAIDFGRYITEGKKFQIMSLMAVAIAGVLFASVGNRHSLIAKFAAWAAPKIGGFYASAGGLVMGWCLGLCAVHLLQAPLQNLGETLAVAALATILVLPMLISLYVAIHVADEFSNRWERPIWRVHAIQLIGLSLLAISSTSSWLLFVAS